MGSDSRGRTAPEAGGPRQGPAATGLILWPGHTDSDAVHAALCCESGLACVGGRFVVLEADFQAAACEQAMRLRRAGCALRGPEACEARPGPDVKHRSGGSCAGQPGTGGLIAKEGVT